MSFDHPQLHADVGARTPRKRHALELFAGLAGRYDLMGALLSFGQDRRWRRTMVAKLEVSSADRVLDVATGTGLVAAELARRYGCSVVGIDQSEEMLGRARRRLAGDPVLARRIELVRGEAEWLPFADREFDGLTAGYLMRYVDDPPATMRELARVVKPGGTIAMLEFAVPERPTLRSLWSIYTRLGLPALGRLASREWFEVGRFLSRSIPEFYERYPLSRLGELWLDAGIRPVNIRRMSLGGGVIMWGRKDRAGRPNT